MNVDSTSLTNTQRLVADMYKDSKGEKVILTPGQDAIFSGIALKKYNRMHIMCHTRYGKSFVVGLGGLTRVATLPEKWAIVSGTKDRAKIIMDYVIAHIFDNDYTASKFVPDKGETIEDIRRYRNKNRVNFKVGKKLVPVGPVENKLYETVQLFGEIFVGTAKEAIGFGAPNVIEEEASLIDDDEHSLVMRMLGDNPNQNFLAKIGNPFKRNHFLKSYHDPNYAKINMDCYRSLKEGRITEDTIEENRPYTFFKVLFENKFPSANEIDESGWMHLLVDQDIVIAKTRQLQETGFRKLGLDVARGGRNYNCWVLRTANTAKVLCKNRDSDPESIADNTINLARENGVSPSEVYVDDTGIGWGITGILKMKGWDVTPVLLGESSPEEGYLNMRAYVYASKDGLEAWVKQFGKLIDHPDWLQLTVIRYKKDSAGRIKIESKDDMLKNGIESPDVADALALTFAKDKINEYHGVDPALIINGGVQPLYPGMPG